MSFALNSSCPMECRCNTQLELPFDLPTHCWTWLRSSKLPSCDSLHGPHHVCLRRHSDGFFSSHTGWSATPSAIRAEIPGNALRNLPHWLPLQCSVSWGASSQTRGFSCALGWKPIVLHFLCSLVIQRPMNRGKASFTTLRGNRNTDCFVCIHQHMYCCFVGGGWFLCLHFVLGFVVLFLF